MDVSSLVCVGGVLQVWVLILWKVRKMKLLEECLGGSGQPLLLLVPTPLDHSSTAELGAPASPPPFSIWLTCRGTLVPQSVLICKMEQQYLLLRVTMKRKKFLDTHMPGTFSLFSAYYCYGFSHYPEHAYSLAALALLPRPKMSSFLISVGSCFPSLRLSPLYRPPSIVL